MASKQRRKKTAKTRVAKNKLREKKRAKAIGVRLLVRPVGPEGKANWRISMSLSWDAETFAVAEAHRGMLGKDRSDYVRACIEHVVGLRPHPELFDERLKPTQATIDGLREVIQREREEKMQRPPRRQAKA